MDFYLDEHTGRMVLEVGPNDHDVDIVLCGNGKRKSYELEYTKKSKGLRLG